MAKWIGLTGIGVAFVGFFFGFFYLDKEPGTSLHIVTVSSVGIVGVLAFVRHVIFHKSDAAGLGWETERPEWAYEVGFANLGFGAMGLVAPLAGWADQALVTILLAYGIYLLQAGLLHGYGYLKSAERSPAKLWRSAVATLAFAGMMGFFAIQALVR